jgi:hypothetical protein
MSLDPRLALVVPFPPPAPHREEERETDPPESGRPSGNLHLQQMRDVLIAARVSRVPLTTGQVETIEKLARAIYYGVIEYDSSYGGPLWEQTSITIKTDYLKAAAEVIQGLAARCTQCGMPLWPGEETFCSTSCRIAAERE